MWRLPGVERSPRSIAHAALCLARQTAITLVGCLTCLGIGAGEERYDYDALGRLVRWVDAQGRVTEYVYDAVGNILEVRVGVAASPPTVSAIAPAAVRRGASVAVTLDGANLGAVELRTSSPQLRISGVSGTPARITFTLAVSATAPLGPASVVVRNSLGQAAASIDVRPALPSFAVSPSLLAVAPGAAARSIDVTLEHADIVDHVLAASSDQPAIAGVTPASVLIAAGQTQASFQVSGLTVGQSVVRLTSASLNPVSVPVFVAAPPSGPVAAFAPVVRVRLADEVVRPPTVLPDLASAVVGLRFGESTPQPPARIPDLASALLGVALGTIASELSPALGARGQGITLVVKGRELGGITSVAMVPASGITVGALTIAPDGTEVRVPLAIAADAPLGARRVELRAGALPVQFASPVSDQFVVTAAQ
ncbi:MAG: hypothetical protein KIT17_00450 [Rubrivivax sp.]|nr:hypothetical protein [Rubrivivax sp.]